MDRDPRNDLFKLDSFSTDGHPCRWLDDVPLTKGIEWSKGKRIAVEVPPLQFTLKPLREQWDHGPIVPDFFKVSIPLVSRLFVAALTAAGVDNFQIYPATIHDPMTGQDLETHVAINVLGVVPNAEWRVDSSAIGSLQMFRIAEWEEWVVTDALRGALAVRIHSLRFRSLRECAGRD